ncbi:MAG: hypothetical protein KJ709_02095 [Nanoarchaeota archaeon]|nr:hypothetical protein [Nanoarchaeota archaeon]
MTLEQLVERIHDILADNAIGPDISATQKRFGIFEEFSKDIWTSGISETDAETLYHTLEFAVGQHKGHYRKDHKQYIVHPAEVMMWAKRYTNDYITLCGALLHDVIEEKVDNAIRIIEQNMSKPMNRRKKQQERLDLRKLYIEDLETGLREKYVESCQGSEQDLIEILTLVHHLSRYKELNQSYHSYIEGLFSERIQLAGQRSTKQTRERAILIKLCDRMTDLNDTESPNGNGNSDDELLERLKWNYEHNPAEYHVLRRHIEEEMPREKFTTQQRLYKIWKNIYVINRTREYLKTAKESQETEAMEKALDDLIYVSLEEATKVKTHVMVRYHHEVPFNYTDRIDGFIERYDSDGLLQRFTVKKKRKRSGYRVFDGTVQRYRRIVRKEEDAIAEIKADKKMQYRDAVGFERILQNYKADDRWTIDGLTGR